MAAVKSAAGTAQGRRPGKSGVLAPDAGCELSQRREALMRSGSWLRALVGGDSRLAGGIPGASLGWCRSCLGWLAPRTGGVS